MALTPPAGVENLASFNASAFRQEAASIADWWVTYGLDHEQGGFWGEVGADNLPVKDAPKCIIQNARILWFFGEAAQHLQNPAYQQAATRAFDYMLQHFWDTEHGGVVWMLSAAAEVQDARKHTYAQAFAIYGLCAYYTWSQNPLALERALQCFELIEAHARDTQSDGYLEARSRTWQEVDDIRLSAKEDLSPKTMNTHLHVMEAYTALYGAVRHLPEVEARVRGRLENILNLICDRFMDPQSGHLRMFMSMDWQDRSKTYSFGHDIEAAWLINAALGVLQGSSFNPEPCRAAVRQLTEVSFEEGLQADGSMAEEVDWHTQALVPPAWWVQAEAMVGFTYAWTLGQESRYRDAASQLWQHIQLDYKDEAGGEWFWYSKQAVDPSRAYKSGAWKGPYHNGRAALLMMRLLNQS